jgi:putative ABC transport system permease protein
MSFRFYDLRDAFRALSKHPLETASALLILALGIGATSAAFSLVDGVILRPLPYPEPERLVGAGEVTPSGWKIPVSPARWALWRDAPEALDLAAAATEQGFDLTGSGVPERVEGARVSEGFLRLLGARASRGRLLIDEDDRPEAAQVAVVSDGFWRRRFGADPSLVGREILLTGEPHTVVGVLERGFQPPELLFSSPPEVWTALGPHLDPAQSGSYFLQVLGRTPAGVGLEAAQAALATRVPAGGEGFGTRLFSVQAETVGPIRARLLLFFGAVVLVLLAACANVGGILLARGVRRERDLAVRSALGADRRRIAALLAAEGAILAAGAALLGLGVAAAGVALLRALLVGDVPRLAEVGIDGRAFAFTVGAAAVAVLLSGLLPAWLTARRALASGMKREGREGMDLRRLLLVAEVALAMMLVVAAGLLARSLFALSAVDPGFEPEGRLVLELSADPARYPEPERRQELFDRVLERVETLPGVRTAALATTLPFGRGSAVVSFAFPGSDERHFASLTGVSPGYFRALGIPLLEGRDFTAEDRADGARAAVVSAATARALWPGGSAVGRRIPLGEGEEVEVVGVVGDVRLQSLAEDPGLTLYRPFEQVGGARAAVVARVATLPELLAADLRQAVWSVDPDQPVARVAPFPELLGDSLREPRATSTLFGSFAVLTALLSALGLYGLMAELVTRRTHEIGVRMALGAGRGRVVGLMMRRALALTAVGVAGGALGAHLASRFLETLLFVVAPTDPPTYAAVATLLLGVAALAAWGPARRAARTDPAAALKTD